MPGLLYDSDHLYVIADDESGAIKVGRALDPDKRLAQFQTANVNELTLRKRIMFGGLLEPVFHALFAEEAIRGEWYPADSMAADVASMWAPEHTPDAGTILAGLGHAITRVLLERGRIADGWALIEQWQVGANLTRNGLAYSMGRQVANRDEYHRRAVFFSALHRAVFSEELAVPPLPHRVPALEARND